MPSPKQLELIYALLVLSRKAKLLNEMLVHELDITINELYILYAGDMYPTISIKDLKGDLELQPASLSRVLGNMYDDGLIERSFNGTDKRSVNIALTYDGKEMLRKSKALIKKVLETTDLDINSALLSLTDINQFLEVLRNIHKSHI